MAEKAKIYLFCVPLGVGSGVVHDSTPGGDVMGHAITADGIHLASHWCSNETWAKYDMGLTSQRKHDIYAKTFPFGYELEWVSPDHPVVAKAGRGDASARICS